jgi:hypothetical protein
MVDAPYPQPTSATHRPPACRLHRRALAATRRRGGRRSRDGRAARSRRRAGGRGRASRFLRRCGRRRRTCRDRRSRKRWSRTRRRGRPGYPRWQRPWRARRAARRCPRSGRRRRTRRRSDWRAIRARSARLYRSPLPAWPRSSAIALYRPSRSPRCSSSPEMAEPMSTTACPTKASSLASSRAGMSVVVISVSARRDKPWWMPVTARMREPLTERPVTMSYRRRSPFNGQRTRRARRQPWRPAAQGVSQRYKIGTTWWRPSGAR